jgi:hypothetical protein
MMKLAKVMHMIGTAHFVSKAAAYRYYLAQRLTHNDVERKLAEGEIFIGKPETKANESVFIREGRYHIQTGY